MATKSIKTQFYEQLAQQAVEKIGMQQFEQAYNQWNAEQDGLAQFQAQYDEWAKANPVQAPEPTPQPVAQPVQKAPVQKEPEIPVLKSEEMKPFMEDYQKQQQLEQMAAERHSTGKGSKEWKQSVNDTLNILNSKDTRDLNKAMKVVEKAKKVEEANKPMGSGIKQVSNLSDYAKALSGTDSGLSETDKDYSKAVQWTDPNYRMTKDEQKEARKIASEGLNELSAKYPVTDKADFGKLYERMSPEDQEKYRTYEDLDDKANNMFAMSVGAADKAVDMLGGALDTYAFFQPGARDLAKKYKGVKEAWDTASEPAVDIAKQATPIAENVPVIGEVTPYGVGQTATQLGAYMLTNDLFDSIGTAVGGKLGGFAANQIGQNLQDIPLDTVPLLQELVKDGELSAEDWKEVGANVRNNAIGNLIMGGLSEIPALSKWIQGKSAAKKAANEATQASIREGAEKLAKLANMEDVDNLVKTATNQAETAAKNIEDISKQIPEVPAEDVKLSKPRPGGDMPMDPAVKAQANDFQKWIDQQEEVLKTQPEYSEDVQEKLFSDFEEIYRSLDNMGNAAEASGSAKAIEKYKKLQNAVSSYEDTLWKTEDVDELNKARKAADAARQSFIREMKKVDPNYKGDLTGTKLGNAQYRLPDTTAEKQVEEMVNDWAKQDIENPNRFVTDAEPETKDVFKGVNDKTPKNYEIQELHGKNGKSRYQVVERVNENVTQPVELKTYKTIDEANEAVYKLQTFAGGNTSKESWKTSKFYENSAQKRGYADKLDEKDYRYRQTNATEQMDTFKARHKDSKDIVRDLVETDSFDDADMRGAMDTMDKLMAGSVDDIRKGSRLGKKISFEGREGGRVVQAMYDAKLNTPTGQLRQAQQKIGEAIDKRVGKGTSESLDNLYEKVAQAYDNSKNKEEFANKLKELLNGDLKKYASKKTAVDMESKQIRGLNKIIKMLDKAESLEGVPIDDLMDVMYKANGGLTLSPTVQKEIYDLLQEASKYEPDSYEFRVLQAKAARKVMAEVPAGLGDYIRTFLYDNMLGNFKTAFSRNFMGNVAYQSLEKVRELPTAAVDAVASKFTGKRSALGWNKGKAGAYIEGFKKGAKETGGDIVNNVNTTRSGQRGWEEALKNNTTVHNDNKLLGHWANQVDFYVENAMKGGDRPIYEANYNEFKTELEQLLDKYGKDRVVGLENIDDSDIPTAIDKISAVRAADAVFQKKGHMSDGLTKLRDGLGELSRGTFGVDILSTASSPFTLTPGNMLERAVEYTPLGFIKNAVETAIEAKAGKFNQRRFAEEAGRSITGLPVLAAAYAGAKKGLVNGGYSTDPDEKQAQIDDGFIEYGLNVPENVPVLGGKTLDTSDLPVYGPFMQAGAVMAEDGITPASSLQAAEAVLGGSATQGIRKAFGADSGSYSSQNGVVENLADTVKSSLTQFVPSLLRQTAQTTDKYKRDLGEYGTNEYYLNSVKNSIPGLRQTLPIKTDVEGQSILQNQGRNIGSKILENYILPMNVSEYKPSPLNEEASRLLKETGEAYAFQPKAKRQDLREWDGVAGKEFTEKQFRDYKENLGKLNTDMGQALLDSKYYDNLSDEEKLKAMQKAYSAMKAVAKYNATGIESDDKLYKAYRSVKNPKSAVNAVIEEMETKGKLDKYGLSDNNTTRQLANEKPDKWLGYYSDAKQRLNGSTNSENIESVLNAMPTLSNSDKAEMYSYLNTDASPGANPYGYVPGINYKPEKDKSYQKAKDQIPSLKPEEYYETKDKIDLNNSGISQEELLNYLNSQKNLSNSEAQKIWAAYGGWTNKKGETKKLVGNPGSYSATY